MLIAQNLGFKVVGLSTDRGFKIVKLDGQVISAHQNSKLRDVKPHLNGDVMTLSAQGMINLNIDLEKFELQDSKGPFDMGENAALWFSRCLLQEDFGLRLFYNPNSQDDVIYVLMNENSFTELNKISYFRQNILVKGAVACEEKSWNWLKIGDQTVFKRIKEVRKHLSFINTESLESPTIEEVNSRLKMKIKECGEFKIGDNAMYLLLIQIIKTFFCNFLSLLNFKTV